MVPESLATSKPVYRPLNKRTPEEMALIEALTKKKRRKSRSVQPSKSKISTDENFINEGKKKRGAGKGKKKQKGKKTDVDDQSLSDDQLKIVEPEEIEHINAMLSASKEPEIVEPVCFKDDLDRFGMENDSMTEKERKSNLFKLEEDQNFAKQMA